jgi:hypothetical protein
MHMQPAPYSPSKVRWWAIPPQYFPQKTKKFVEYTKPYFLIDPGHMEVSTPKIISGLSAYHPEDRILFEETAIKWCPGLLKSLLVKSFGRCRNCNCSLIDQNETV